MRVCEPLMRYISIVRSVQRRGFLVMMMVADDVYLHPIMRTILLPALLYLRPS